MDASIRHARLLDEPPAAANTTDWARQAATIGALCAERSAANDHDHAFPDFEIDALARCGLLRAPFPAALGGAGLGSRDPDDTTNDSLGASVVALRDVLVALGRGSLAVGRLYEGHANAVILVRRYGSPANLRLMLAEAEAGRPSGVWMAGPPLRLERSADRTVLRGFKLLASGSGHFHRPLVAADDTDGSILLLPHVADSARTDDAKWLARGMKATATGTVDFDGLSIAPDEIVGRSGDYLRSPFFRGGAWRVIAVQFGGLQAIFAEYKRQLATSPHRDHPLQLARFGEAAIALETARLWVWRACDVAEGPFDEAAAVDAYVDLARNAFEGAALRVVALAQKALGLNAFLRPNPIELLVRDLETYLRQPALDLSLMSAASFHLQGANGTGLAS